MKRLKIIILMFVCGFFIGIGASTPVFAKAECAHTQEEALEWLEEQARTQKKFYSGQCVALIRAYYEYLLDIEDGGLNIAFAKGYATADKYSPNNECFQRIHKSELPEEMPQPGDICIDYRGYALQDENGNLVYENGEPIYPGHIWIYKEGTKGFGYHQNYMGIEHVKIADGYPTDFWGVIRPIFKKPEEPAVSKIYAGSLKTAIIKNDDSLWVCGWNLSGNLGDGTKKNITSLKKVMEDVSSISLGPNHTAILKTDGSLWMCGHNEFGQFGDGEHGNSKFALTPKKVMEGVADVSCGHDYTAILKTDGSLWMCGYNHLGELGNGTTEDVYTPVKIMEGVAAVDCATGHTDILTVDGKLFQCGMNNFKGDPNLKPEYVTEGVSEIRSGDGHTAIIMKDGSLWMYGANNAGQFGNGKTTRERKLERIMDEVSDVSCGYGYSAIIKSDGSLWTYGWNDKGKLGNGTEDTTVSPERAIMSGVSAVSCGYNNTVILKEDGSVWICGNNSYGQIGNGATADCVSTPVQVIAPIVKADNNSENGSATSENVSKPIVEIGNFTLTAVPGGRTNPLWTKGSGNFSFTIKEGALVDQAYDKFTGLFMDNSLLTENTDYTRERGSIILNVKEHILKELSNGTHVLKAQFGGEGEVTISFNVKPVVTAGVNDGNNNSNKNSNNDSDSDDAVTTLELQEGTKKKAPKTGEY